MLNGVDSFRPISNATTQPRHHRPCPSLAASLDSFIRFGAVEPTIPFPDAPSIKVTKERLNRHYKPWAEALSPAEKFVVAAYTDFETPKLLNQILRDDTRIDRTDWEQLNGFHRVAEKIGDLDHAIAQSTTPEPLTVYRGLDHMDWETARRLVGTTYSDASYGSCSLDPAIAGGFGDVLLEIPLPKGTQAAWLSPDDQLRTGMLGDEAELLLPRGYRLTVTGAEERTVMRNHETQACLVLKTTWCPPGNVPSAAEIVDTYAGKAMVQHTLRSVANTQVATWTEPDRQAVSRIKSMLAVVNAHCRGRQTFDRIFARYETEIRSATDDPGEIEAELQKRREFLDTFRRDIATADRVIRSNTLGAPVTLVFHSRDNDLEHWLPSGDPANWVGQTVVDPGFSRLTPDVRKGVHSWPNDRGASTASIVVRCHLPKETPGLWLESVRAKQEFPDSLTLGMNQRYTVTQVSTETVTREGSPQSVTVVDLALAA